MAEGLQRRIEYSDLKFISSFAMEKILDFQTWEVPGEHASEMCIRDSLYPAPDRPVPEKRLGR